MKEWLSLIADVAGIATALFAFLGLWQWVVDRSRPKSIGNVEDAFEKTLDELGSPFKEDRFLRLGPVEWAARKLRRWRKEEEEEPMTALTTKRQASKSVSESGKLGKK